MGRVRVAQASLGEEDFLRLPLRSAVFAGDEIHNGDEFASHADAAHQTRLGICSSFNPMAVLDFFDLVRVELHG